MQPSDSALVARISLGDPDALQQLYERHSTALYAHLWYELDGDDTSINEVMQDTFVAVWRSASSYRGDAQVKTWLYRIAHNAIFQLRRHTRRQQSVLTPLTEASTVNQAHVSHEDAIITRLTLGDALGHLSAKHYAVLELVLVQGFSLEEVAQLLGVPVGTVKSRLSYARRDLMKQLATNIVAGE